MKWLYRVGLAAVLIVAAALRLTGINWDDYQHHHPDERYVSWVATTIEFPALGSNGWAGALDPQTSTFNPFHWPIGANSEGIVVPQDQPRDFAYGHLPLYLGVLTTRATEKLGPLVWPFLPARWTIAADIFNSPDRVEFQHITAVSRALTALVDVITVLLTYLLGKRLHSRAVGLLAAALLAITVLHIQLAHFFVTDPFLTCFVMAALLSMVAAVQAADTGKRVAYLVLAGVMSGLAVGSKFSAALLLFPLGWTFWLAANSWRQRLLLGGLTVLVAIAAFVLTNPFAVLDTSCPVTISGLPLVPDFTIGSCYLDNINVQNAMVRGQLDLGFTRQYDGTIPYLYFVEMQLRWGLGFLLGMLVLGGGVWTLWSIGRTAIRHRAFPKTSPESGVLILLLWIGPYFLITGSFYVKFMRYIQPIIPPLIVLGVMALWQIRSRAVRGLLAGTILVGTALYALAFVNLYSDPHPWNSASEWIHRNIPAGTLILSEQWDDFLPATMMVDNDIRRRADFENAELTWLSSPDEADDEAKLDDNLALLARADYLTVLSQRVYGVVPRQPDRYPLSSRYHQLLFAGALGYEPVWVGGRTPHLFGINLWPNLFDWPGLTPPTVVSDYLGQSPSLSFGRVDESFTVYDQPLTMIFRNTGHLTEEELRTAFGP